MEQGVPLRKRRRAPKRGVLARGGPLFRGSAEMIGPRGILAGVGEVASSFTTGLRRAEVVP